MDLRQLSYLVAVADAGGFSGAAAALHLSQPTLSRQIGLLERDLGQRLFVRTGRGVQPTEAGELLVGHARDMLQSTRRARDSLRDLQKNPGGRIAVGLPPRVAVGIAPALVQRFRETFPRAMITISEGLSLQLREHLVAGRLDLALLFDPAPTPQLAYRTLTRESLCLVASARSPALPKRIGLATLARYPMVLPSAPNAIRSVLDDALRSRRIALDVVAEVSVVQTVLALVARGVGCTVLPVSALSGDPKGLRFQHAAIGPPAIRNHLVLATPMARPATRLTRETAAMLQALDLSALGPRFGRDD